MIDERKHDANEVHFALQGFWFHADHAEDGCRNTDVYHDGRKPRWSLASRKLRRLAM